MKTLAPVTKTTRLDELGFVSRGRSRHRPRNDASLYGGECPFFQTGDIKAANLYLTEYTQTYSQAGLAQSKMWEKGTLCITIAANIAETAILGVPGCFPDSVVGFVPDPGKADVRFIKYYIDILKLGMQSISRGTTQDNMSVEKLMSFDFNVPDLPTQRKIAGILSAYDDLIENNLRRIKILEEMVQSLYREWFVHFRFPGHESARQVDSELGPIPKGWEVRTIEELVKRIPVGKKYDQKTANPTGIVPIFDQGKTGVIGYHDDQPGVEASETEPVIVFANHTCYQRLVHYSFSAIQNVLPFRPNPLLSRNTYWLHYATDGRLVLNDYKGHWPEFAALRVIVPPAEVCQSFGAFVAPLSLEILKLERAVDIARRTRNLLLPKLLSDH